MLRARVGGEAHRASRPSVDPSLGEVVADPGKLKQVLYNYLSNALKFTPDDGRVDVQIQAEGPDFFRIEVEDTGIGIRPEDMGKLFIEFQQLESGMTKKYSGTGLGLVLTKRMVEAQGGRVGAESTLGQGSLFFAVLPRLVRAGAIAPDPGPIVRLAAEHAGPVHGAGGRGRSPGTAPGWCAP